MIEIKSISGELILSAPVLEDAVSHRELMVSDYVQLSWSSDRGDVLPAGAYIEHDGERYALLEPYTPERASEDEYRYRPQFQSRTEVWDKHPACVYTYEGDGTTVKSREFDWTFTGSPADAMSIILQAIRNETGETWSMMISDSLPATINITCQASSIKAVLASIAGECETEYWADKRNSILHLSKCETGENVTLRVGENVGVPSVTAGGRGYYTRYYPLGSTRNITQGAAGVSGVVNKRLTLDPKVYPMGYKDVRGHYENGVFVSDLLPEEVFSKVVIFDDIFPSSSLEIYDVRARLKYDIQGGDKVIVGGTEEEPVYQQYAVWYFKIRNFTFSEDMIIKGQKLMVHFKGGQLAGNDFELKYHAETKTENHEGDVLSFTVEAGDYEILFKNDNGVIVPGLAYIIPEDGNPIVLYNIEMPAEYTASARLDLEAAVDKLMADDRADGNTYEVDSNPVAFQESGADVGLGQRVTFVNGDSVIETRVLMVEKKLDYPCQQRIRVGNNLIKGSTKELRENVESLNKSVDVIAAFNDLSKTIQDGYARTQAQINEALANQIKMFYFADDETIGTKYNFFSEKENSAGGVGEVTGTTGGGIDPDELEDILNEKGYATEGYVNGEVEKVKTDIKTKPSSYVPLKTINGLSLYGSGNINVEGSGGGSEGLTAINVNGESFQPDGNGIVALPDYPSALPSPKTLTFGSKTYDGSEAKTITETDVISDINTIRTKLGNLENYDDSEVKADIATLEGYFTNGKAKNADKLDGQDSSYFATAQSVSSLTSNVTSVTNDVSALKPKVASNEGEIATLKGKMSDAESSIATQGDDIASLKNSMLKAEEDIADNSDGIKGNAEDISDLDKRLGSIESWYNNVGIKFSKDTDGTIMMDGDFYTTGENSAGGVGDSVGGTGGGGIDTEELDDILKGKGYATETWVNGQGFAKGIIPKNVSELDNDAGYVTAAAIPQVPTRVSQLENDANYLASITGEMVRSALTYTPFNSDNFTKLNIKNTLGISDWALAASKPTYYYSDIVNAPSMSNYATKLDLDGKVDKVAGKGLSTNDYTTTEKNKLASLENYDDTDIKGRLSDLEDWYDEVGSKFTKESDGTIKMEGDFFTTGENSASGAGEAAGGTGGGIDTDELDDILDAKGYATETWVNQQGFAKGTIPTTTSQLRNDSGFITTATADGRYASVGDFNDLEDRVQSIESGGGTGSGDIDLSAYATKKFVNDELGKKVDKEDGMGLSENNYTDEDKSTLASLAAWHSSIGSKFTIEGGAVKMDGDFFTTGENSAGGHGESVGSTGGGLDEKELEDYLTDNKYAKQSWVTSQGYAKGTIPTRVSQLDNDAKYLASITSAMVTAALGYTPFSTANFTKLNIKNTLGISDWALGVTKPAYNYNEIANTPNLSNFVDTTAFNNAMSSKVDKVTGKGLSTNDYTTAEKNLLAGMSSRVDEAEEAVNAMSGIVAAIEEWYNRVSDKIDYDIDEDAIVVTGDLHATGENSAGGLGEDIGEWGDIVSRLTTLENKIGNIPSQITQLTDKVTALESSVGVQNVRIKVSALFSYNQQSINSAGMTSLTGLTVAIANDMLSGKYNKVIDESNSATPKIWNYTAIRASTTSMSLFFSYGDGFNSKEGCRLDYNASTAKWSISIEEEL